MYKLLAGIGLIGATDYTKKMLDDMATHFSEKEFDTDYYAKLNECMAKFDDEILIPSQNAAWKGMIDYFKSNGTDVDYMNRADHWGGCTPDTPNTRCDVGDYKENILEGVPFGEEGYLIYEPCNYASNLAYYHSATRVCDYPNWSVDDDWQKALKRAFTTHAMGSAMWHGSHTYVGYSFDNNMIAVVSYLAHQASVSNLPGDSSILKELSATPRKVSGLQVAEDLVTMFSDKPVDEWAEVLDTADLPHVYFITFAALISTVFSMLFPWEITQLSISFLSNMLIPKEDAAFITGSYLPELREATKDVQITGDDKWTLFSQFIGMLMKIGYAFLWQEFFIPLPFLYDTIPNHMGAAFLTTWNQWSADISGVPQTDEYMVNSSNLYPGQAQCKGNSPHSLWHEESANGLLEIVFLADTVNGILSKKMF